MMKQASIRLPVTLCNVSINEQFDENGNATYTVKKENETRTISEEEYYNIFEKYSNATVVSFAYGASDAAR